MSEDRTTRLSDGVLAIRFARLSQAVRKIYYAARWTADRPCDADALWQELRDAAGLPVGGTAKMPPPEAK